MSRKGITFDELLGLSKQRRKELVVESGLFERKRFLLTDNPEARNKIRNLREAFYRKKIEYPELLGMTLFGSHTKGYANQDSDFDARFLIDRQMAESDFNETNLKPKDLITYEEQEKMLNETIESMAQSGNWPDRQQSRKILYMRPNFLRRKYDLLVERIAEQAQVSNDGFEVHFIPRNFVTEEVQEKNPHYMSLAGFFSLGFGDLFKLRREIIEGLEKQGPTGQQKWRKIMWALAEEENPEHVVFKKDSGVIPDLPKEPNSRIFLYPQNTRDARKYFLLEPSSPALDDEGLL